METSRLAQLALDKLIERDGPNVTRFVPENITIRQWDNQLEARTFEELKLTYMCSLHCCGAEAHNFADTFDSQSEMNIIMDEETDLSEFYTKSRKALADIHEATLVIHILFAQILRMHNRENYEYLYL